MCRPSAHPCSAGATIVAMICCPSAIGLLLFIYFFLLHCIFHAVAYSVYSSFILWTKEIGDTNIGTDERDRIGRAKKAKRKNHLSTTITYRSGSQYIPLVIFFFFRFLLFSCTLCRIFAANGLEGREHAILGKLQHTYYTYMTRGGKRKRKVALFVCVKRGKGTEQFLRHLVVCSSSSKPFACIELNMNTKAPKGVEICYFIFSRPFITLTLFLFEPKCVRR